MKSVKQSIYVLIMVLYGACISSCNSDEYSSPLKGLKFDDIVLNSGKEKTSIKLGEENNERYETLSIFSNAKWCTAKLAENMPNIVNISVEENKTYEERQAIITISDSEDDTSLSICVIQKQNDTIIIDKDILNIPEEGGEVSVNVQSNLSYIIEKPANANWLTYSTSSTRGLSTSTIVFKAEKNNSRDIRKATIRLTDKENSTYSEVVISQELTPIIQINKKEVFVPEEGGEVDVEIETNAYFNTLIDVWWVEDKGYKEISEGRYIQKFKVSELPTNVYNRSSEILFTEWAGSKNASCTFIINQGKILYIQDKDIQLFVGDTYEVNYINYNHIPVVWKSSNSSIATVNENGKIKGVGSGTTTISVSSTDGKYSDQVTVTVKHYDISTYISGSAGGGYAIVAGPTGTFAGYYVSCSLKNGSSKDITVNKCTIYENGSYIGAQTNYGTLKAGQTKYAEVSNRLYDITTRSYKFVWEYSYNGKAYTYTVNYK